MFRRLLGELDGQVPHAILCVDAAGRVRAAALPAGCGVLASEIEGTPLATRLCADETIGGFWRTELARHGHVRLTLGSGNSSCEAEIVPEPPLDWEALEARIDPVPAPILLLDVTGRILRVNPRAAALLGRSDLELRSRTFADLLECMDERGRFKRGLSVGRCEAVRTRLSRAARQPLVVDLAGDAIACESGRRGWLVRLRQGSDDEREAERWIDTLHGLIHDLRTPISSLRAFSQLLERDFGMHLDELGRRYLERLRANTARVHALVEDLIDHGRIPARETGRRWTDPREVLSQVAAELKAELELRDVRLFLPEDPALVFANPSRFQQVVLNLLYNAVQHMGEGQDAEIRVNVTADAAGTTLEVRDNGRGIVQGTGILELFSRRGAREGRGSGLGLSIVRRIVLSHGGRVDVESQEGQGASFRAFFPAP